MDVAVSYHPAGDELSPATLRCAGRLVRLTVFDSMLAAAPLWRRLEESHALATPYQRFDLLSAWLHHVGTRAGVRPFIVAGVDTAGEPLFVWPFGRRQAGPFGVLHFLGSKHANFNVGLWRQDIAGVISPGELLEVLASIPRGRDPVDVLTLFSQPLRWNGIVNPFALLARQPSVDSCVRLTLGSPDDDTAAAIGSGMRSRLRGKERKLQKLPGYRYVAPATAAEIDRLLDGFLALKAVHMTAQGLPNVFAEPGVAQFLREACHRKLADGRPLIELHALEADGELLALFGATVDTYRFSCMFNTYTLGEHARHSPGLVLLQHMITDCAERGVYSFDIGVGRAHYKSMFCKEPEPLFDSFVPLSLRGRVAAQGFRALFLGRRFIKEQQPLWAAVQFLRRFRARG
jgi:CelD/BcsL family acetyltransferase involved in cellulose biosynthesis